MSNVEGRAGVTAVEQIEALLATMAAQQEGKVLGLARRLKPGLTAEDVRNPHDFAQLSDPDFHYEDGILAGFQAALTAVRALRNRLIDEQAASGGGTTDDS